MSSSKQFFGATWALFLTMLSIGCQPAEQVETYTVAPTTSPRPPLDATIVLQRLDHILVAIVPQDDKAWFFKLVGKAPVIERQREAFHSFIATVKLADSSAETPTWELPEGWEEKEAKAMRAATLVIPDEGGDLELAVSSLTLTGALAGDWEDFLVPNVNRWLGQLQRSALPKATILGLARQAPIHDRDATVFELSGNLAQQPKGGNPHAGLGIDPPSSTATQPVATAEKPLTYEMPSGWQPGKMNAMRKAAFLLPGGEPSDEVTVTSFPAAPGTQMDDVAANVERWAGQVGTTPPTDTEPITISGIDGDYVELTSPAESDRSMALYVAMIKREGQVWFFKMIGNRELVDSQRAAFREFLDSVRFQ